MNAHAEADESAPAGGVEFPEIAGARLTNWEDVMLERTCWLMLDRLPFGELTIVEGPGGVGKTTMLLDILARVTTGRAMPDGTPGDVPGHVLLFAEEERASTLKAKLLAAGADLALVHHVISPSDKHRRLTLPSCARQLRALALHFGVRVVMIDALFNHFDKGLKSNNSEDVRAVLTPLSEIAHETGAVFTGTRHWGKTARGASERGLGSADIGNVARSVLVVGQLDEGPRILALSKTNLAKNPARVLSLTFTLEDTRIRDGASEADVARVVWGLPMEISADDLATVSVASGEEQTKVAACAERIRDLLAEGPQPAEHMEKTLVADHFSRPTIYRAAKKAHVHKAKATYQGKATWSLPSHAR
jgi:hypothetical protein